MLEEKSLDTELLVGLIYSCSTTQNAPGRTDARKD